MVKFLLFPLLLLVLELVSVSAPALADGSLIAQRPGPTQNQYTLPVEQSSGNLILTVMAKGSAHFQTGPDNLRLAFNNNNSSRSFDNLTMEKLKNAEFTSENYGDGPVRLRNGRHEIKIDPDSDLTASMWLTNYVAFGDLDGDRIEDAAVVLASTGGGSGVFYELATIINQNGIPKHVASQSLGDRVGVKDISIRSGTIKVEMLKHRPNDPLCCPTMRVAQKYQFRGQHLEPSR